MAAKEEAVAPEKQISPPKSEEVPVNTEAPVKTVSGASGHAPKSEKSRDSHGSLADDIEKGRMAALDERPQEREALDAQAEESLYPEELKFLASPECNPDLKDPAIMKQGNMSKTDNVHVTVGDAQKRAHCGACRAIVGVMVYSYLVQTIVLCVILLDLVLTVLSFTDALDTDDGSEPVITQVGDLLVVIVLSADVLGRFFYEGCKFLKSKMNIFELVLVPITILEVFALKESELPLPVLRALRPVLRATRIIRVIVRTAGKGRSYLVDLRHRASGDRVRFEQDGFDLDLAYITSQIIAMPKPAVGSDSVFYNPVMEVARFFNERHGNKYLILNVMEDEPYPVAPFFNRYYHFPIRQDSVPTIEELRELCLMLDRWMKMDPDHIVAVSSKHAQGRSAIVCIALLICRGTYHTVAQAVAAFEKNRLQTDNYGPPSQTWDSPSQKRFLEYFVNMWIAGDRLPRDHLRPTKLKKIQVIGASHYETIDVYCYSHNAYRQKTPASPSPKDPEALEDGENSEQALHDEDDLLEKTLDVPQATILERLQTILDESSLDAQAAGCSKQEDPSCLIFSNSSGMGNPITYLDNGTWVMAEELSNEFVIEVHRRIDPGKVKERRKSHTAGATSVFAGCIYMLYTSLRKCCCCGVVKKKEKKFDGGLLFAMWFSSNFIELDEERDPFSGKGSKDITVRLDKFSLDKGAGAPSLRNYSQLQVRLEFEVEEKIDWLKLVADAEADGNQRQLILSGVDFSEMYSCAWLTWVSEKIWPSFQAGFTKLIHDSLEPSLAAIPVLNISLQRFSLGGSYPKFPSIQACSRYHDDSQEVQLDIALQYSTETDIVIEAGIKPVPISFGINLLKIEGLLSLKFKPILQELPVFVAMQLLFLNSPTLDLRFSRGLEAANSSMVKDLIFSKADEAIADLLVLPNIMNINWADSTSSYDSTISFQNVLPCALARVSIVQAKDIYAEHTLLKRMPDCFVRMKLGGITVQTTIITQSNHPNWNEEFDFLVYDTRQHISGKVMNVDIAGRTRSCGKIPGVPVQKVVEKGEDGMWIELGDVSSHGHNPPAILVRVKLYDILPEIAKLKSLATAAMNDAEKTRKDENAKGNRRSMNANRSSVSPDRKSARKSTEGAIVFRDESPEPGKAGDDAEGQETKADGDERKDEAVAGQEAAQEEEQVEVLLPQPTEKHAGAVALLIFEVCGARLPEAFKVPDIRTLVIQTRCGNVTGSQACSEAGEVDLREVSQKQKETIEKLHDHGLSNDAIADSMGIDKTEVDRLVRKRGWNMLASRKASLLLHPSDIENAATMEISLHNLKKKKCLAEYSFPLRKCLGHGDYHAPRHDGVVKLKATRHVPKDAIDLPVEMDICVRMYALEPQMHEEESFL